MSINWTAALSTNHQHQLSTITLVMAEVTINFSIRLWNVFRLGLVILSMTNYNDFQRKALLFKTLILVGMKLCKNLLVLTLGKRYCVLGHE